MNDMRVELEPVDLFLQLMRESRPCPACGSTRVTVCREDPPSGTVLRSECADCRRTGELAVVRAR